MGYTIKQISNIIGRKPAMIYNYFNESEESKAFYYSHREMGDNGSYIYDDEALERLKLKVGVSNVVGEGDLKNADGDSPQHSPAPSNQEVEALKAELEDLKGKYEALQSDFERAKGQIATLEREKSLVEANFEKAERERVMLLEQNGMALLSLSKMLPPPSKTSKTIGERIKGFFHRAPTDAG